jgi:hypothetical protein
MQPIVIIAWLQLESRDLEEPKPESLSTAQEEPKGEYAASHETYLPATQRFRDVKEPTFSTDEGMASWPSRRPRRLIVVGEQIRPDFADWFPGELPWSTSSRRIVVSFRGLR